jgi:hypothetical protein
MEGFSQIVSVFKEASQNFISYFLHNKAAKNFQTINAYTESTNLIFKTFKQIFHLVIQSLKNTQVKLTWSGFAFLTVPVWTS